MCESAPWGSFSVMVCTECSGISAIVTAIPAIVVAVGSSRTPPGSYLEGVLRRIEYGGAEVNHIWLSIDFTLVAFLVYGTAAFTTVFFVLNCLLLTSELIHLHQVITDEIQDGKVLDTVAVSL